MRERGVSVAFSDQQIQDHIEKWVAIGLATGPSDFNAAEAAIKIAYAQAGLDEPNFIRLDSPQAAIETVASLEQAGETGVLDHVYSRVYTLVRNLVRDRVHSLVFNRVFSRVFSRVYSRVYKRVYDRIENSIHSSVHWHYARIAHLAGITIFRDAVPEIAQLDPFVDPAVSTGICCFFEKTAILTERPSRILFKREGEQEDIILIEYPDGFTVSKLSPLEQLALS